MGAPPPSLARRIGRTLRASLRSIAGDLFPFKQVLSSGVLVVVRRPSDFATYSEIFVDGFYDQAIHEAIQGASGQIRLLDLGSNVGFFPLRVADLLRRSHPDRLSMPLRITMVEGVDAVARESRARLALNEGKVGEVEVLNGLVGKTGGQEWISTQYEYGYNSIIPAAGRRKSRKLVPYLDLRERLSAAPFDLVKCDIEGAEEIFLDAYGELLARQRRMVFEFHHQLCDTARCDRLLRGMGFERVEIFASQDISMVYYRK